MGKATVEGSLRLDAHYWGQPGMDRLAPKLAALLAQARARGAEGERPEGEQQGDAGPTGLMEMRWTRGGSAPAGNLKWGVLTQEGGQVRRLVLLFQITSRGTAHLRRQSVGLDWTTPAGKPSRLPVLLCPFCGRRCRFLCSAYPGQRGGPYLGEFACRQCAGLCYAQQLEYQSEAAKDFRALRNLSAKFWRHPERVTDADFDRMDTLTQDPLGLTSQLEKLLTRLEGLDAKQNTQKQNIQNTAYGMKKLKKPHERDVPPPVVTPPKRRGRPSVKKQRQQARECARLVREAEQQARPKHPVGRPKVRREYDAAGWRESGCGGRLGPGEGYCVGCRGGRRIVGAAAFTASNGRGGVKGKCADCGRGLCRMGSSL